jgi:hypothetical protein
MTEGKIVTWLKNVGDKVSARARRGASAASVVRLSHLTTQRKGAAPHWPMHLLGCGGTSWLPGRSQQPGTLHRQATCRHVLRIGLPSSTPCHQAEKNAHPL